MQINQQGVVNPNNACHRQHAATDCSHQVVGYSQFQYSWPLIASIIMNMTPRLFPTNGWLQSFIHDDLAPLQASVCQASTKDNYKLKHVPMMTTTPSKNDTLEAE